MPWTNYGRNMKRAAADLPDGGHQDVGYAIPDVYGKPLQLYFELDNAIDNQRHHSDVVQEWRGLLALVALQEYLNLPLFWEKIFLPEPAENLLDSALCHPPDHDDRKLFPQDARKQWDGRNFFVLKWREENGGEADLLLYSPITLVYPVADRRKASAALAGVKWFDAKRGRFLPAETALNKLEKEILYFWLKKASESFNLPDANEAQQIIKTHLGLYLRDLNVVLAPQGQNASFNLTDIDGGSAGMDGIADCLKQTVHAVLPTATSSGGTPIAANQIFADQICYFQMDYNPFSNCYQPESYKVRLTDNWYAFLPISPDLWDVCGRNGLVQNVIMERIDRNGEEFIHVTLDISGKSYETNYKVVKTASAEPGIAVPYQKGKTDRKTMALISIWPGSIGETWKNYYVMLNGSFCDSGDLVVADQGGVHRSSNLYVVQTDYVPYAIPIVKKLFHSGGEVSVGMVIPTQYRSEPAAANVEATVAVDFGTSATIVYAKIDDQILKIDIGTDFPLLVTACDDAQEYTMRDYFVPPASFPRNTGALFSVYRRSGAMRKSVEPVIDGVIYRTGPNALYMVKLAENSDGGLMSDLKWQVRSQRAYYIAFMKQLVLHVTILLHEKGVTSIHWKYAFPKNMDTTVKNEVQTIWEENIGPYLNEVAKGIRHTISGNLTESEAASRYFLFRQGGPIHPGKGYLVVDIGGGSTDIALWQGMPPNAQMKWHTSVNVAGRKLFTHWIKENLKNLCENVTNKERYDLDAQANLIDGVQTEATKESFVEMLLSAYYKELLENYNDNLRNHPTDGWGTELQSKINQGISVLMFALGYQVGALLSRKDFTVPNGPGAFVIAFGGRGSNMLDWLPSKDRDSRLTAFFSEGIKAAGGALHTSIKIVPSDDPKCEVATGLLVEMPSEAADSPEPDGIPMDTQKYIDAADTLKRTLCRYNRKLPGNVSQALNPDTIAAEIDKMSAGSDQIVNTFMEIIYNDMIK